MRLLDLGVLAVIAGGVAWWCRWLWHHGARRRLYATAWSAGVLGVILAFTMTAHTLDVLFRLFAGTASNGQVFGYDFRAYALLLVGALLAGAGVYIVRLAMRLGTRVSGARIAAVRALLLVLIVVAPQIPFQAFFAIPITVLVLIALAAVATLRDPTLQEMKPARVESKVYR